MVDKPEAKRPYDLSRAIQETERVFWLNVEELENGTLLVITTEDNRLFEFRITDAEKGEVEIVQGGDILPKIEHARLNGSLLVSGGSALKIRAVAVGYPIEVWLAAHHTAELPITQEVWINGAKVLPFPGSGAAN